MFSLREAMESDLDEILNLIKELAEYEEMSDQAVFTKDDFYRSIFVKKYANALVMEDDKKIIGYAIYYHSFSTFLGKGGIYLEDIYIKQEFRNMGYGRSVLKFLAKKAIENDLSRIEWQCLKSNKSSLEFYKKIGAKTLDEWHSLRLDLKAITNLSN